MVNLMSKLCFYLFAGLPAFTNSAADVAGAAQCFRPHSTTRAASKFTLMTAFSSFLLSVVHAARRNTS